MRIGVLGPEGTFSETAALLWLTNRKRNFEDVELTYYVTIFDVAESIVRKDIEYGIVPIENSLEGSVGETLDLFSSENAERKMHIIGEILVPIKICLLAKGPFKNIRTVVSHPHALAQCKQFIREQLHSKGVKVKSVDSTGAAAKLAKEIDAIGALASEEAAKRYGLSVLEENVQDQDSVTRFVVLSSPSYKTPPTGKDKTSILVYVKDRPGALYDVLGEFYTREINLTKIESRPSKRALGDYMFHIDCEGHADDNNVKEALQGVQKESVRLKILGAYPAAGAKKTA
jgi:prephenate dehydratase